MSARTEPTENDEIEPLNCPSFQLKPKESGVVWVLWWDGDGRSKALLEPITADDHYQVGLVYNPGTEITYQPGDPYTPDPTREMLPQSLRDVITTVCDLTLVDVEHGGDQ